MNMKPFFGTHGFKEKIEKHLESVCLYSNFSGELKTNWWKDTKRIIKYLALIHHLSIQELRYKYKFFSKTCVFTLLGQPKNIQNAKDMLNAVIELMEENNE